MQTIIDHFLNLLLYNIERSYSIEVLSQTTYNTLYYIFMPQ